MKVLAGNGQFASQAVATLVVSLFDATELSGSVTQLGPAAADFFRALQQRKDLSADVGKTQLLHNVPGVTADGVLVVGCGKLAEFNVATAFRCGGAATKRLADRARESVAMDFGSDFGSQQDSESGVMDDAQGAALIAGAINGCVGQDLFRSKKKLYATGLLTCWSLSPASLRRGICLGEAMLLTRELVNLPANYMYPEAFAQRAAQVAVAGGIELEVWDEMRLRREQCNALLAVSAGSSRPPRLLVMRYPGKSQRAPIALVGKGVTFDSGGLSIKPSEGMLTMKCDMAGAATVLGAMQALATLQVDTPVVAVIGLVENMISGNSFKLGDVLTARSGKTIEIHNTDAEGRLVLADALNVALDENPSHIVDLATLTGACVVALGTEICGLMSNNADWQAALQAAAERAGELLWPLPMHDLFSEQIQSKVADIKNVGEGRWGGAITAAKFLQEFVGSTPWAHLDIAGPAFADSAKDNMDAGGTGRMLRTLVELIEQAENSAL